MTALSFLSATELAALLQRKEISSEELTSHYIDRIEKHDGDINSVVVRRFEQAIDEARQADTRIAKGETTGPLEGLPMTIKESYVIADTPVTCLREQSGRSP